jgi:uncharacterized membrane protein
MVLIRPLAAPVAASGPATSVPAPAFRVEAVQSDKVLYAPGEAGILRLQLRNDDHSPRRGRLVIELRGGLADRQVVTERNIEVVPSTGQVLEVPFVASGRFGYEARASLQVEGQPATSASDFFAVATNFFEVGIGYNPVHGTQSGKHRKIPPGMRRTYSNWIEFLFWAPCDWSTLVSPLSKWWSGQASYPEDEANVKELIGLLHEQGMKVAAYASCNPAGPFAWDLARRKPQWFFRDSDGGIAGTYDVEQLTFWNDPVWRDANDKSAKRDAAKWCSVPVDLRNVEALDWGIDQIADSARHYGWDAVRFDGHSTLRGDDERSAWNMRRLKQRVLGQVPDFRFAFNYGRAPEWRDGVTHEMRDALAGGGGYVQEGIRNWRYTGEQYKSWLHYATNELRVGRLIGSMGGSYHCIWQLDTGNTPAQRLYKLVYGLIAGGHPMYGSHAGVLEGCDNWGAFMTRWSALLWDPAIQPAADAASRLSVEPASRLEWRPLIQQCVAAPDRKFLIVHLVNPPTSDEIATGGLPGPVEEATTLRYQMEAGTSLLRAMLVRPAAQPYERPLEVHKTADGAVEVQVPSVQYWAMVVFELAGTFRHPKSPPPREVTAHEPLPPPVSQLAGTAAPVVVDPNKTENQFESGTSGIWATDRSFSGHAVRKIIADPKATGGKAQARELAEDGGGTYPFMGRPWMGPFRPGRYRVAAHLKYVPPVEGADSLILRYRVEDDSIKKDIAAVRLFAPGVAGLSAPDARRISKPGEFEDYVLDVTLDHSALLTVSLYPVSKSARSTILLDHIRIEPVEIYTDAQLAAQDKPPSPPAGIRTPSGAQPQRVLLIRGMFHQPYGADRLKGIEVAYEPPQRYEELFNYDGLVMCDIGVANWPVSLRWMIKQWIEAGGRLVVLGGPYTLGQGGMPATFLEEVLPVTLKGPYEVVRCEPPLAVSLERPGDEHRVAGGVTPVIFWRHDVSIKNGATVLAWAGDHPLVVAKRFGAGRTLVFTGAPLGEAGPGGDSRPLWETDLWRSLLKRIVLD